MSTEAQQLRAIFETAKDCFIIIDTHGKITKVNPAGAKLFGYEEAELLGQNIKILMPSPHYELHDSYIKNYEITGEKKLIGKGRDVYAKRKDGTTFPCHLSVSEFYMKNERCYVGIIHDLTLRKKNQEEIIELNRQLEQKIQLKTNDLSEVVNKLLRSNERLEKEILERRKIERALRDSELEIRIALEKEKELNDLKLRFVSVASHEFRTPLSTILSSTTLIQKYLENGSLDKTEKHFDKVKYAVNHLTEVLDDFLSLTKLEEGKVKSSPQQFMLLRFCQEFIEMNEGLLKDGQFIEKHFPKKDLELTLDKKLLNHILLNLFSNSIKYSKEGSRIICNVQVVDNQLVISIKDEGVGIPLSEQKHLFARFFRGSNVINIQGTGLGLNIVKKYLEMMNGTIHFESKVNEGATFEIRIPV
ncbi:MAG TPA: PAS domain S-box protein [Phaeodactylibacter sp.]|nr:PAS domain S-box protein [Phaeodactylibacter sp.]